MQEQFWVISQMAIEIFMLILLVIVLKNMTRNGKAAKASGLSFSHPEKLLEEMRQISESLEKNLEEKRTLTRNVITELEMLLSDAENASRRLEGLMNAWQRSGFSEKKSPTDTERLKKSAMALLEKGIAKKEIARRLDIPVGELELMLKLQSQVPHKEQ